MLSVFKYLTMVEEDISFTTGTYHMSQFSSLQTASIYSISYGEVMFNFMTVAFKCLLS